MLYSANNAKLKINDNEILASNAQLSLGASLQPTYLITQRNTDSYAPTQGIGGKLDFNYFLTGRDYFKEFITGQGESPQSESQIISGNFGGLTFDSGYLTSYSVNFGPNAPAVASAGVVFFDDLKGVFSSEESAAPSATEVLNFKHAVASSPITSPLSGHVDNFIAGTYNYSAEVKPVYLITETKPSAVSFGPKSVNMNFEIDNPTGQLPISGSDATISVSLFNTANSEVENFTCAGKMNQRNIGSAVGDVIKQSINIIQGAVQAASVYVAGKYDNSYVSGSVGIGTVGSEGNI